MKKYFFMFVIIGLFSFISAKKIFLTKDLYGKDIFPVTTTTKSNTSVIINFDKSYLNRLKLMCDQLKDIYHSQIYCVAIDNNTIKALYDGNETNQTKLLNKFRNTFIPSSLFLKPFIYAFSKTENENLKNFILKYKNLKLNILKTALLYKQTSFDENTNILINDYFRSSTEDYTIEDGNQMIVFNDFFYYLKLIHYKKNNDNQTIYSETFNVRYEGNGFGCSVEDCAASSYITIKATFPQINTYYLEFNDNFSNKVVINFPINTSYYINYGVATFNNKLLSLNILYKEMGCCGSNTYGYFKTFNIDLKHFRYLKLSDFFDKKYITKDILGELYKTLKEKYGIDWNKEEIYKDFMDQFAIDKKNLYFYFDQLSVTSDAYGYFVIKIPYKKSQLKFKF